MKTADLNLDTIAKGAIPERFRHVLQGVLDNILDPNTEAKDKRRIVIEITFRPTEERTRMDVDADVSAKLAPPKGATAQAYIGQREGEVVAVVIDPEQTEIFGAGGTDVRPLVLHHDRKAAP